MELWNELVQLTKVHFAFLEADFSMSMVSADPPFVVYASDVVTASIYCDVNRWRELSVVIRRVRDLPNVPNVGLSMMALVKTGARVNFGTDPFVSSKEQLDVELARFAALLKRYGSELLLGDEAMWARIDEIRRADGLDID